MTATIWCKKCSEPMLLGITGYPTCKKCKKVLLPPILTLPTLAKWNYFMDGAGI